MAASTIARLPASSAPHAEAADDGRASGTHPVHQALPLTSTSRGYGYACNLSDLCCCRSGPPARIVENGFATTSGLSKSAKVVLGRVLIKSRLVTETRSMSALAHFADSSRTCTLRSGELLAATKEAFRVPQNLRANERIGICSHHNGPRLPTWGPTDNIGF